MSASSTNIGRCLACDYALQGLPEPRCPECGRPFDPRDPATMNFGRRVGPVARWLMSPIGWPTFALFVAVPLLVHWGTRDQYLSLSFGDVLLVVVLLALLAVTQMVWLVVRVITADLLEVPRKLPAEDTSAAERTDARRWRRLWTMYVVLILPLLFSASFRVNFALSRDALDRFASQMLSTRAAPAHPLHVGGFVIAPGSVKLTRSTINIRLTDPSRRTSAGLAYDPSGLLEHTPHANGAAHLGGDWYWWNDG